MTFNFYIYEAHDKSAQLAAEKRGGTAEPPHFFVQSLRSFLRKNVLYLSAFCGGRYEQRSSWRTYLKA